MTLDQKKKKKNLIARAKCNKSLKVETSLKEDNVTEEVKKKKKHISFTKPDTCSVLLQSSNI